MTRRNSWYISARIGNVGLVCSVLAVAFLAPRLATAAGERFDFAAANGTLGFGAEHDCELRVEPGKGLVARSTGKDPYFVSPSVSLRGISKGELVVRAAFEGPARALGVYFATDKSPQTGEDKVMRIAVRSDGTEREYRVPVGRHELWQGTITRYRFDLEGPGSAGAMMRLASVRYTYPAAPQMNWLHSAESVVKPGTTTSVSAEVQNPSPDAMNDLEVRFVASTNTISISPARAAIATLAPDERTTVRGVVRTDHEGVAVVDAILTRRSTEIERRNVALCVAAETPAPGGMMEGTRIRPNGQAWAVVMNTQALVVRLDAASGLAEWWGEGKKGFELVGRIFPLAAVLHGEGKRCFEVVRWHSCERSPARSAGMEGLILAGGIGRPGEEVGEVRMQIRPEDEGPFSIHVEATLEAKRPIHLRAFMSPRLLLGDGAFGEERDEGLFPGVEYLEKGERSSNKLDYHTDEYLRTVPHPKKITVPLMALTQGNHLFMLRWDSPRPEGDGLLVPAAGFASPNFADGQENHLMTLSWPSVPGVVAENEWEARKPVLLKPGDRLTLEYSLYAVSKAAVHVSDALPILFNTMYAWGLSFPYEKPPRDSDAERGLCRVAYTDVIWREKERGWNHALPASATQWAPQPYPFNLQFLESERTEMTSGPERNRISQIIEQAAGHRWKSLGERAGADDYYFVGDTLLGCIEARQAQARALMRQQRPDGSWGFQSRDPQRAELGPEGKAELGIVADHAIPILQYALMTGDREAEAAGLKALEHMKRYVIPRAAQVWEIPLHTPDIMGSARGATAYRLGYLLTGQTEYLERAEYWIKTGWPFVYFWGHPKWSYWAYATIPVFGATHYRAPNWEGLPVQWCGLVYAEESLRCAPLLTRIPYCRQVAEGIVRSAMWQQPTQGEYRGLLPDSYPFASKQGNGPFINPETILRPLWLIRGFDFRVNSVVVPRGNDRSLRLSAVAAVTTAVLGANDAVIAKLSAVRGLPFGVAVCGLTAAPSEISWQGHLVPRRDRLERNQESWCFLADRGWLLANLIGTGKQSDLKMQLGGK
jgi:hypothetical protein